MIHKLIVFTIYIFYIVATHCIDETKLDSIRKLGDNAYYSNKLSDALNLYTELITYQPNQINYFQRAATYIKLQQYDDAITDLTHSIELDNKFIKGLIQRAKLYKTLGNCNNALNDINNILKQNKKHKQANDEKYKVEQCITLQNNIQQHINSNNYIAAKHELDQLIDIIPNNNDLLLQRSKCNYELQHYDSVLLDTRNILNNNNKHIDAMYIRGNTFYVMNELDNAINHYKEILKLDPEHNQTKQQFKHVKHITKLLHDGDNNIQHKKYHLAIEQLNELVSLNYINKDIYRKLAESYKHNKQGSEALKHINNAMQYDTNDNSLLRLRAEIYLLLDQYQDAINDYTQCTQRDHTAQDCHQGLHNAQVLLKRSTTIDYYKELGVDKNADISTIKKAYRKLAMQYHPDKQELDASAEEAKQAEDKFKRIAESYEVLSNDELRRKYDAGEDISNQAQQQGQQHFHPHFQHPFGGFGGGQQFHAGGGQTFSFRFG